ncbi:MAG: choice-of-anchor I family protein [Jiangellales bacterium]
MAVAMRRHIAIATASALTLAGTATFAAAGPPRVTYDLRELAVLDSGSGEAGAEIVAFDEKNDLVLVTNGAQNRIDIFDLDAPTAAFGSLDLSAYGGVQSVAVKGGKAVAAVAGDTVVEPGFAVFFDPADPAAGIRPVQVGALPDMVTFTPNGRFVLVANEGEPRCVDADGNRTTDPTQATDPEGSISVIPIRKGQPQQARTATFTDFNPKKDALASAGVRFTWPGATVAEDAEPEYIAVDPRSRTAYVSLQENNALAVVDIRRARVTTILPLGLKDYSKPGNEIDASDRDSDDPRFASRPAFGMYQPDGLDGWTRWGRQYVVTANEGDGREYFDNLDNDDDGDLCFIDEARVKDVTLDATVFPNAPDLQEDESLGRLKVSQVALSEFTGGTPPTDGDDPADVDGLQYTSLASYGARSITIWSKRGDLVWDSGSELARTVAAQDPQGWTQRVPDWATDEYDSRSDDKGVEPESVVHGRAYGRDLLFVGLERAGGVITYDATRPWSPQLQGWTTTAGAISPEGLAFVSGKDSPTGRPLLLVAHEVSGTTVAYEVVRSRSAR